jgi:hypothetical protein
MLDVPLARRCLRAALAAVEEIDMTLFDGLDILGL